MELNYETSEGKQLAYYVPPRDESFSGVPRVWVLFPGNASLALDWLKFIALAPERDDAFLLMDYPGYGGCEGSPSPASIQESAERQ